MKAHVLKPWIVRTLQGMFSHRAVDCCTMTPGDYSLPVSAGCDLSGRAAGRNKPPSPPPGPEKKD